MVEVSRFVALECRIDNLIWACLEHIAIPESSLRVRLLPVVRENLPYRLSKILDNNIVLLEPERILP